MPDRGSCPVHYAGKHDLERAILTQYLMIHMGSMQPDLKRMPVQIAINAEE